MKLSKFFSLKTFIYIALLIISFYSLCSCLYYEGYPSGYGGLFLLPLSFFISNLCWYFYILKNTSIEDNLPSIFLIVLTFLRNVLTPIAMVNDSFVSSLGVADASSAKLAIWLIFYETIVLYVFLYIIENYRFKQQGIRLTRGNPNFQIYIVITFIMLFVSAIALIMVPSLRNNYYTLFTSGFASLKQIDVSNRGSALSRALGTGGDMAIAALRYTIPCAVFYKLAERCQNLLNLVISIIIVILQGFFMTDSNAYILMIMISQMLFILKLYPRYRKMILSALMVFFVVFALIMYFYRFALNHYSRSISLWLQSYMPGIANTAGITRVEPEHNIFQIFTDFYVAIPFKAFIGLSTDAMSTAALWRAANGVSDQILSTIGQSYYYFGFMLSPMISCFLLQIARKCRDMINSIDNVLLNAAYIYLMIYSVCTPFVYNFSIYLQAFLQRTILIFIIAYFSPYRFSDLPRFSNND